jgi:glycine betaine/proline transport system ATP-binding protein
MSESPKIVCKHVWKIFGTYPERTLENLDRSLSRAEVQAQTGHVIGVNDVSFEVFIRQRKIHAGALHLAPDRTDRRRNDHRWRRHHEIQRGATDRIATFSHEHGIPALWTVSSPQGYRQHFHRKVIDNISFGLEIRGTDKKERKTRAMEVLEKVGLHGWADHYPRELSGGMQQRVGLARAMAVDPEILIFDEPFSALDPLIRREMQDELLNIQAEVQKTMIFITHDFLEAIKMGDHIAIMKDGGNRGQPGR